MNIIYVSGFTHKYDQVPPPCRLTSLSYSPMLIIYLKTLHTCTGVKLAELQGFLRVSYLNGFLIIDSKLRLLIRLVRGTLLKGLAR